MTTFDFTSYYELIGRNKTLEVIKQLLEIHPTYKSELVQLQSRYHAVSQEKNKGTISAENFRIESNGINTSLLAFLDSISKGNNEDAKSYLSQEDDQNDSVDELIENQLKFSENAIKENKIFRKAVGVLFIVAIIFSVVVAFRYYDFLSNELQVIGLLIANILLYVSIGVLALYSLSLIIKGSLYNRHLLNFSKKTIKK